MYIAIYIMNHNTHPFLEWTNDEIKKVDEDIEVDVCPKDDNLHGGY